MRRVDPKIYTKDYYLTDCTGHQEFKYTLGELLEPRFKEIVPYLKIHKNLKILDIGCGRGELVYYCAKLGGKSYGIDYAKDAIQLANLLKEKKDASIKKRMSFIQMDAKKLLFPSSFFSTVILTDVVEHLYEEELELVFKEIKRVLRPQGSLIIHTAPNRLFNDYIYKYYCYPMSTLIVNLWNNFSRNKYPNIAMPSKLRADSHSKMHINEPTYYSLYKLFQKYNFKGFIKSTNITVRKERQSMKDLLFNLIVFLDPLSRLFPLNIWFGSDFFSVLKNTK
ncbi:MAG: hypothetical protein A3B38_01735 [Candidatus Levybacteria bacterium RIFCSPLOWO2_01_FULL_36_13]|nr:MAG: hypothetical protein A2684_02970 [Candidatus Levybacteria bacterium RIFCSPHIGHO2_01_FULL_36_15b]OGH35585.1 MAG: hypothetical protein A3B38_01735 [Candidatus Levybacteria bacterium RIFCSPLOWO2_01_FULL_36_13]